MFWRISRKRARNGKSSAAVRGAPSCALGKSKTEVRCVKEAVRGYLQNSSENPFQMQLREWAVRKSHGQSVETLLRATGSPYRRALLELFERGWEGEPVLEALEEIGEEIQSAAGTELDEFVASLPFRAMLPLLLLQFPAYLILLLGPVFSELLRTLGAS